MAIAPVAPVITSASFDQPGYTLGQTMTLTVDYTPGLSPQSENVTIDGLDSANQLPASVTIQVTVLSPDSTTWTVTDAKGRVYTQVSDNGSVAVFTAIA